MPYARSPNASIPNKQWGSHGAVFAHGLSYCLFFLLLLISLFSSRSDFNGFRQENSKTWKGAQIAGLVGQKPKNGMLAISNQHSKCIEFALLDTFSLSNSVDYSTEGIPQKVKFCLGSEKKLAPSLLSFCLRFPFPNWIGTYRKFYTSHKGFKLGPNLILHKIGICSPGMVLHKNGIKHWMASSGHAQFQSVSLSVPYFN